NYPERVPQVLARVRGEHEPRARVHRLEHSLCPPEQAIEPLLATRERTSALVELTARRRAHLLVELRQQRLARIRRPEHRQRLLDLAAIGVRVEVAKARRAAAPHLPVSGRVLA